ncbi:E3 ubiquitin-protein ligase RNF8-like isoform X2 [Zerene cesonia]|uniref:E3 ubiquitin-protein ligase RNF8-like isoform X2 n=1 Tax=Zerene cesonia TaxID=33412 RepID=UPI0018E5959F|nr:E3 ubiquitin-protein ligase RNF8-like isoform X2 [Zerene cesonia]
MEENMPKLISCKPLKNQSNVLNEIKITEEEFTLGRGLKSSVVIPSLYISRSHCCFKKQQHNWVIIDHSTCGIELNGIKMGKGVSRKLLSNDIIKLEPSQEFVYKFHWNNDCPPTKRIKLEPNDDDFSLNDVKIKFEESQNCEIKHLEDKIHKQKQIQKTNELLKNQIHQSMNRKMEQLNNDFALQIENLKGEKIEVEKQKSLLLAERNAQVAAIKKEMDEKIKELMEQIKKHNEIESELVIENNSLKEKLLKEREDFLSELSRESSSKQDLLEKLEGKMKEQEELRLKEKMELEQLLQKELEQLRLAKERELHELAEQQRQRELELMEEHNKIKENLEKQIELTEKQKQQTEQQLSNQVQEMKKLSYEDKLKMEQLIQEREEIQKRLLAAKEDAKKSVEALQIRVEAREVQLAALAAQRIHQQSEQSGEVINSLQEQLEKVKTQLRNVECEKEKLLENASDTTKQDAGSSKQVTLTEVGEIMESELQCSICAELFVSATTLSCSHTFCKYCITTWKKKKKDCPICRAPITSECRSLVLDSFIDKMVQNLTDEMKKKRQDMLKNREEVEPNPVPQPSPLSSRRNSFESDWEDSDSALEEGPEEEYYDDFYYEDNPADFVYPLRFIVAIHTYTRRTSDSNSGPDNNTDHANANGTTTGNNRSSRRRREYVPGVPGSYYGGYGHCYRCGAIGHWAPGCPRV